MIKIKIEKKIIISFIGLIIAIFVGFGGNIVLKAGLPASGSKTEVDFEKRLQELEAGLASGNIAKHEFDSLSDLLRLQKERIEALHDDKHIPEKMPEWVCKLGVLEPVGMKFDQIFSNITSVEDPSEGFNSVSLVYTGPYDVSVEQAARIAASAKLSVGGLFKAKGSPGRKAGLKNNTGVSYLNYSLGTIDQDYLISVQVEPSGRLTIMATDNKQLNRRLLVYEPMNNRQNSVAKRKKQ